MTTYTRNTLSGSLAPVNNELEKIEVSLREKLDRNPSVAQNNEMLDDLDMNSNRIINYPDAVNDSDLITKGQVASLAPVQSVDGQTGNVLSKVQSVNGQTGNVSIPTKIQIDNGVVFDNISEMKSSSLGVGQLVKCKRYYAGGELVEGLVYEVQATATVDGYIDHANANGTFATLILGKSISVKQAGAIGDGIADDTLAIQATIDYAEDFGGSSQVQVDFPVVFIPTGRYLSTGILIPSQINIEGSGRTSSVLLLEKNSISLIKKKYPAVATANIAIRNLGLAPDNPVVNLPTGQRLFDARGFTKSLFDNITINWCGGCDGVSSDNAPYTGSSNWYLTFNHCFVERLASWPAGGSGWVIGSDDSVFQQSTTWTWTGGRTSGAGNGNCFNFKGCSTMNLFGHTTEGGSVFIGSNSGDRLTRAVIFYSCYAEAVSDFEFRTSANICGVFGGRITGVTVVNNGTNTTLLLETTIVLPVDNTGTSSFSLEQAGSRYPKVKSLGATDPAWQFESSTGDQSEIIGGGDVTNRAFRFFANNATTGIAELGTNTFRPATTDTMTLGEASRRWNDLHISDSVFAQGSQGVTGDFVLTGGGTLSVKGGIVISYTP